MTDPDQEGTHTTSSVSKTLNASNLLSVKFERLKKSGPLTLSVAGGNTVQSLQEALFPTKIHTGLHIYLWSELVQGFIRMWSLMFGLGEPTDFLASCPQSSIVLMDV